MEDFYYDEFLDESYPIYDSWVVNECEERLFMCGTWTQQEIDDYLSDHPEYRVRTLPRYL